MITLKRFISAALIVFLLTADALAAGIDTIIPETSLWGISRKDLQETSNVEYTTMEIGKTKVLQRSGIEIDDIPMEAYYVFNYSTWDSTGYTYNGLSKIVYLLADCEELDSLALRDILQQFIDTMTTNKGKPDSVGKSVSTWNMADCKIEIGIGTFKKYTGSKHKNVAIVFSGVEIPKPVTPPPTPVPTPVYTYIPPTPKPTRTPKPEKSKKTKSNDSTEMKYFDPFLANTLNLSAHEWFAESMNRAMLTSLLAINIASDQVEGNAAILTDMLTKNASYVGRTSNVLVVVGSIDDYFVSIMYIPGGQGFYGLMKKSEVKPGLTAEMLVQSCDRYYKNSTADIMSCLSALADKM